MAPQPPPIGGSAPGTPVREGDVHGADGLVLLQIGAGDAGDADADGGAGLGAGGGGHGAGGLDRDDAVLVDHLSGDAPGDLLRGGVGDEAAEDVGGGAGDVGEGAGEEAAGGGFHGGDGEAAFLEEAADGELEGVVVLAPDDAAEDGAQGVDDGLDQGLGLGAGGGLGGDAQVDAVRLGVDADGGVGGLEQGGDHLVDGALAQAGGLDGAGDDHGAGGAALELGGDLLLPHARHLGGGAGHGDDEGAVLLGPPAGGGAARIGDGARAGGEPGLLEVALGHGGAAAGEPGAQLLFELGIDPGGLAEEVGDGVAGDVVLGGAEAAGGEDEVGALKSLAEE